MKHTFFSKCTKMPFRYRTAFLLSRIGNLTILAGMTLLLGGCQAGGSIWKETISLEPKDKTVSEETLDPETDIDGQVESEQVDGAELGVEMQGQDESGKLEAEPGENDSMSVRFCLPEISIFQPCFKCLRPCGRYRWRPRREFAGDDRGV